MSFHKHQYYEFFITLSDDVVHLINGEEIPLKKNTLVFIRPGDRHTQTFKVGGRSKKLLNISFSIEVAKSLFAYLSSAGFEYTELISRKMPPMDVLSESEKKEFLILYEKNIFTYFFTVDPVDDIMARLNLRAFLAYVFTRYFIDLEGARGRTKALPHWLEVTCDKMNRYDNFSAGLERMVEISGKSQEYLARCMNTYFGMTTTEYINELRLNYAANILVTSDIPIIDVIFDCGFQSVGYFYKLFNEKYKMSPTKFKKINRLKD